MVVLFISHIYIYENFSISDLKVQIVITYIYLIFLNHPSETKM